jgi:hypothetical protein
MNWQHSGPQLTEAQLAQAEANSGLRLPQALREHYLRVNGGRPVPHTFDHGGVCVDVSECLPLESDGTCLSAIATYRMMALSKRAFPRRFFPFAVDGGGNLFLVDCESSEAGVYVWWHDVACDNFLDLKVTFGEFWTHFRED